MRVGVAISGGMDSAATGLMLKNEGHEIVALHMRLFDDSGKSEAKARQVASLIGAPLHVIDLVSEFRSIVLDHFIREYTLGRTPSPCPRCNRFIKFGILAEHAWSLGCEKIATGHYANISDDFGRVTLKRGQDKIKDQSYFLFMLTPEIMKNLLLPLGPWEKSLVRKFLKEIDPVLSEGQESQELCFIENNDYPEFLRKFGVESLPGPILDTHGNVIGRHKGIINYTVGQRRGLGVCGPFPRYVISIDRNTNSVVIGLREETFSTGARISELNIIHPDLVGSNHTFLVKIRSTARPVECVITKLENQQLELRFIDPQSSVAPGQAAVFYLQDTVVMGGWIDSALQTEANCG